MGLGHPLEVTHESYPDAVLESSSTSRRRTEAAVVFWDGPAPVCPLRHGFTCAELTCKWLILMEFSPYSHSLPHRQVDARQFCTRKLQSSAAAVCESLAKADELKH